MRHGLSILESARAWLRRAFVPDRAQPGRLTIARVRLGFASLLFMLLAGVFTLLNSALDRLARERILRHEVVAERVFDELERELNAHLERESARPSSVYDAPTSQVDTWAPYVVGYFTVAEDYRVLAGEQLAPARKQRIDRALGRVWPNPSNVALGSARNVSTRDEESDVAEKTAFDGPELVGSLSEERRKREATKMKMKKSLDQSPEVLRRLNRAQEARQKQAPAKPNQDPFAY